MNNPNHFWRWFSNNESRFRDIDVAERAELLNALCEQLHAYCGQLWCELGRSSSRSQHLIITASGNTEFFPEVEDLVDAAPAIEGWEIIAFKPALGFNLTLKYEGIVFSPKAAWFMPLETAADPDALGVRVAYAHFDPARLDEFMFGTSQLLDAGLGERVAAESIEHVEVGLLPTAPEDHGYIPLTELPAYLASLEADVGDQ